MIKNDYFVNLDFTHIILYIINEDIENIPAIFIPANNLFKQGQINVYHMFDITENIKNPSQSFYQ